MDHDQFRRVYPFRSNRELGVLLGISPAAVVARAQRLGIRKDSNYLAEVNGAKTRGLPRSADWRARIGRTKPAKGRPSDEDLTRAFPFATNKELAARYGVSPCTIHRWGRELGLRKDMSHWRRMQSERALGRIVSPETRAKISAKALGRVVTRETMAKVLRTKIERGTLLKGDRHPNWKGGRPWERFKRPEYVAWRNAVLARDSYRCQDCGRQCRRYEKGLAAHHVRSYAGNPERRYDVSNGVTLCRDCHMARHGRARKAISVAPCACGCGKLIATEDRYGRPRRFVNHHNRGYKYPESGRAKLRAQRRGRSLTPEHRRQISLGMRRSTKRLGRPPKKLG